MMGDNGNQRQEVVLTFGPRMTLPQRFAIGLAVAVAVHIVLAICGVSSDLVRIAVAVVVVFVVLMALPERGLRVQQPDA